MKRLVYALALAAAVAAAPRAHADAKKDQAALAQLDAAYQPTGKLAGADRTKQACVDATKLKAAAAGIPQKRAPAGSAIDDTAWMLTASGLLSDLESLAETCAAPGHQVKHLGGKVETADDVTAAIDKDVRLLVDGGKPRALPDGVKKFAAAFQRVKLATCAQEKQLAKLAPALASAPAGADAAKWQQASASLTSALAGLEKSACGSPRGADEEVAGAQQPVHDAFYDLVLLVPPR